MQNHVLNDNLNNLTKKPLDSLMRQALGATNPYITSPELEISQKQIEILEDAIKRYERLEDIKRFSNLVLDDIETVTEDEIKRALELENTVSIDNEQAVLNLIQNEGFLKDLESADFSNILSSFNPSDFDPCCKSDTEDFCDFDSDDFEV